MNEAEWQRQVIDLARLFKWRVAHFRPALTKHGWRTPVSADGKGFPDICLIRERVIFAELKSSVGKPSPDQVAWAQAITAAGVEMYLWKPEDLEDVAAVLRKRRPEQVELGHAVGVVSAGQSPTSVRT